jgi:SAM-dependent methyltransferase
LKAASELPTLPEESVRFRTCPVCCGKIQTLVFAQDLTVPGGWWSYAGYRVVACGRCGFLYADRSLAQGALDKYYASVHYKVGCEKAATAEWSGCLPSRLQATVDFLAPYLEPASRLLDVGCGSGELLHLLKTAGFANVRGIDSSRAAVEAGRARYGVEIASGSVFECGQGEFDAVTVCHVLEHLTALPDFLLRLYSLVSPTGIVYVEVPNAEDFERFADPKQPGDWMYIRDLFTHFAPEHVNFFSRSSLRNLMRRFGFVEVRCQTTAFGAIASLWRRANVERDTETPPRVMSYARASHELQAQAVARIRLTLGSEPKILVWGAGLHTQRLLGSGILDAGAVVAFIDSDPVYRGSTLAGRPILSPAEIPAGIPILISSYRAEENIVAAARRMDLSNRLIRLYA